MRRTTPVEPSEPAPPAEPLSHVIKGGTPRGLTPNPVSLDTFQIGAILDC